MILTHVTLSQNDFIQRKTQALQSGQYTQSEGSSTEGSVTQLPREVEEQLYQEAAGGKELL